MENLDAVRVVMGIILFVCGLVVGWRTALIIRLSQARSPQPVPPRQIDDALDLIERQRIRNLLMDAFEIEKTIALPAPSTVVDLAERSYRSGRLHGIELALHILERIER